mgnify:CR=1 FL=1
MSTSIYNDNGNTQDTRVIFIFKNKVIKAIVEIRDSRRRPDLDSIFNYVTRSKATNIDRHFVETIVVETN